MVDKILSIDNWLLLAKRLGVLLSINDCFENSCKEFEYFTGNKLSIPTLQKHVEYLGEEFSTKVKEESKVYQDVKLESKDTIDMAEFVKSKKEVMYVGVDGTGVPMRSGGTKEAKVGVIFKEESKWYLSPKRNKIIEKQYVATLDNVNGFIPLLFSSYLDMADGKDYTVVCLGDGAHWIWNKYADIFPDRIEILDFYHVSEYIWEVARNTGLADLEINEWVDDQLNMLKESKLSLVLQELNFISKTSDNNSLREAIKKTLTYFESNKKRMNYKAYIQAGLAIGSGVVESSNKVVVTKRLKQGGMHWSIKGAESIIFLRALYCSKNQTWNNFWNNQKDSIKF